MASLPPGRRLGVYEIVSLLGAGGMGEVYRARDTRLDRIVAIKVMPPGVANDPQFRARFDREARAISQLQHPHICTLYDVGEVDHMAFLVMELLQGQTLADRLEAGALPIEEALKIGSEVADALSAAHRQGIVHRDLKPANIMLTKAGAKLLDFGLAKAAVPVVSIGPSSTQQTTRTHLTASGTILGTLHYMSPEQVEGKKADARSDIWALGCVLYETLTGQQAFRGDGAAQVIGGIMADSPRPIAIPHVSPRESLLMDDVVQRCLAKHPEDRWQNSVDLRHQLFAVSKLVASPQLDVPPGRERTGRFHTWPLVAAILISVAALSGWWLAASRAAVGSASAVTRLGIAGAALSPFGLDYDVAIAPDASFFVYRGGSYGQLILQRLDRLDGHSIPGVAHARQPSVSPDGRWIAYFENNTTFKKVAVAEGRPCCWRSCLARREA